MIHGRVDRDGYTVEKVFFESYPGFFVTGNLYRPKGRSGKLPAVLSPHGHWPDGRFNDARAEGDSQADRRGGGAVRGRRAVSAAGPLRAIGADGLRGVPLRHGRLCRQPAIGPSRRVSAPK